MEVVFDGDIGGDGMGTGIQQGHNKRKQEIILFCLFLYIYLIPYDNE